MSLRALRSLSLTSFSFHAYLVLGFPRNSHTIDKVAESVYTILRLVVFPSLCLVVLIFACCSPVTGSILDDIVASVELCFVVHAQENGTDS